MQPTNDFRLIGEIEDAFEHSLFPVLVAARKALAEHPPEGLDRLLVISAMCRLSVVSIVGCVDALLAGWRTAAPKIRDYIATFTERDDRTREERISALHRAFEEFDVKIDDAVVADYAALRDLRHLMVHIPPDKPKRAGEQRQNAAARSFPSDPLNPYAFSEAHWNRIWKIYFHMRHGIYTLGLLGISQSDLALRVAEIHAESPPPSLFSP